MRLVSLTQLILENVNECSYYISIIINKQVRHIIEERKLFLSHPKLLSPMQTDENTPSDLSYVGIIQPA